MGKLKNLEKSLYSSWKNNLKAFGVKFPSGTKLNELICLYDNLHTPLSQDDIEKWFKEYDLEYKR